MTDTRPNPAVQPAGKTSDTKGDSKSSSHAPPADFARETIESIVIAFVLAFLFRTFVAEAFVIPTGSMATTLMGAHKDLQCPNCSYWYQASASSEYDKDGARRPNVNVVQTICPSCGLPLDTSDEQQYPSYKGDRIIVSKFGFRDPARWNVVVFRYPEEAGTNYIKRLVGLPGEVLRIRNGDLYVQPRDNPAAPWRILRKPPPVVLAMLREVYDNNYVVPWMTEQGWPPRWQACPSDIDSLVKAGWGPNNWSAWPWPAKATPVGGWISQDDYRSFTTDGSANNEVWLRYQHFLPGPADWRELSKVAPPEVNQRYSPHTVYGLAAGQHAEPQLISDFTAYNYGRTNVADESGQAVLPWVGDLALECRITPSVAAGEVILELVKGQNRFQCRLALAEGTIRLSVDGSRTSLADADGKPAFATVEALNAFPLNNSFSIMFANVDGQLLVWIDGRLVSFSGSATYEELNPDGSIRQVEAGPADYSPAGIAAHRAQVKVDQLRILRDVHYLAYKRRPGIEGSISRSEEDADDYELGNDEFFVLGDNSPKSSDARMWPHARAVQRDLLIGKALFIYWPHSWDSPLPFTPNWKRMRFIK
jgi:signal peptidase I